MKFIDSDDEYQSIDERQKLKMVKYSSDTLSNTNGGIDFEAPSQKVIPAVVHIQTVYGSGKFSINAIDNYLNPYAHSSGSGVIISDDGYIITNNHVIEDASSIEVVLNNNQRFFAKVIGTDPSTDLALLKVKAKNLPFVRYGDSDNIIIGEWVLAIGNPFNLNSTVTAGIISAKARNIGILRDKNSLQVESFIQTDAAVNPGNSGGALVNLQGELIGINSAIATATGGYAGYSFSIPINLAKKIMNDLLEFGQVQRGLLGVRIQDVDAKLAEDESLDVVQGVYISFVNANSSAELAGIHPGDVITKLNDHEVNSTSELQEWVARKRPGDQIDVTYRRNGEEFNVKATLKNYEGLTDVMKKKINNEIEGATFEDIPYSKLSKLNLDGGVIIKSLTYGKWKKAGLQEDFIIAFIDKAPIDNVEDLNRVLAIKKGGMLVEGFFANGQKATIGMEW
jgi:Do/DeqQ family serine protease